MEDSESFKEAFGLLKAKIMAMAKVKYEAGCLTENLLVISVKVEDMSACSTVNGMLSQSASNYYYFKPYLLAQLIQLSKLISVNLSKSE